MQNVNAWISLGTAATCLLFVVSYAVLARWWRTYEGKIMMSKAAAIMLLTAYTFFVVKIVPESTALRVARIVLVALIGVFMLAQTAVLMRRQLRRQRDKRAQT